MDNLHACDITSDDKLAIAFRKKFLNFYQLQFVKPIKLKEIFSFLEKNKNKENISFEDTITYFYQKLGSIFIFPSGAIISTINPKNTPFNNSILKKLNLKLPSTRDERMVKKAIEFYPQIQKWYEEKLNSASGKQMIQDFDAQIQDSGIEDIKKIDLILWANKGK